MLLLRVGDLEYPLDPSAISALRYRSAYGDSVVNHLAGCRSGRELERVLLRMCHMMIPPDRRPPLEEFARQAGRDRDFTARAREARAALLAGDPRRKGGQEGSREPFDEFQAAALLAAAGLGTELLYELPILQLLSVAGRVFDLRNPDRRTYRPMTGTEMATLYGRRNHGGT